MQEIKYVVTNPSKDLLLRDNDVVFVLALADPRDHQHWEENVTLGESEMNLDNQDNFKPTKNREED